MTYPFLKISRSGRIGAATLVATALWRKVLCILVMVTAGLAGIRSVHASAIYDGSISGIFSDPLLTGEVINVDGSLSFLDNTTTAVYSGVGTNTISWGANPSFSSITFTGNSFSGVPPNQPFLLGTVTYTNGTSALSTLIFGATLTLTINSTMGGSIDPSVSLLNFVTTVNGGIDPRRDADFVSFDAFPQTFNVFEGHTAIAELFGMITGDPTLTLTGIRLAPGQLGNGFIGQGQPTPDASSTLGLMGVALGALAVLGIKRKNGQSQRSSR